MIVIVINLVAKSIFSVQNQFILINIIKRKSFLNSIWKVELNIEFNKRKDDIMAREVFTIEPGMIHGFSAVSSSGAVIEINRNIQVTPIV